MNRAPGRVPSSNYLDLEEQLVLRLGPEASNLHIGRSRNDLGATSERIVLREETLALLRQLAQARAALLKLAEAHVDTVIPAYTHAVQAQPTTMAHYLGAYLSALERDEQRLREAYARINQSPLGAAAFTTSGFALRRDRLRELLGFSLLVENSYDAIMVSSVDSKAELASVLSLSALNLGRFAQQFLTQYGDSRPFWNLADEAVGHSSIMPQKRNPRPAEQLRIMASTVVADAQAVTWTAHNTPGSEVADIRIHLLQRTVLVTRAAVAMYKALESLAAASRVDPLRSLEIVNNDFSLMTELADTLLREAGVPFRTGHRVASEVAAFCRERKKRPADLTHEEVAVIYQRVAGTPFPLSPSQLQTAFDPQAFVRGRRGDGGPQPVEMQRMLQSHARRLDSDRAWAAAETARLNNAEKALEIAFSRIN